MIRNTIKLAAVAAAALTFGGQAYAQNTVTKQTEGSVTIVAPITLTQNSALAFGKITRPSAAGTSNTVTLSTATCTSAISAGAGDASVVAGTSATCATYTVGGEANQGFSITGDTALSMTGPAGSTPLAVTLTRTANSGIVGTPTGAFKIGGSFTVADTTVNGAYSGQFAVTVTYQ